MVPTINVLTTNNMKIRKYEKKKEVFNAKISLYSSQASFRNAKFKDKTMCSRVIIRLCLEEQSYFVNDPMPCN